MDDPTTWSGIPQAKLEAEEWTLHPFCTCILPPQTQDKDFQMEVLQTTAVCVPWDIV